MAKAKKDSKPVSLRMDADTFTVLEEYCEKSGQSKTVAIERAIMMIAEDYDKSHSEEEKKD